MKIDRRTFQSSLVLAQILPLLRPLRAFAGIDAWDRTEAKAADFQHQHGPITTDGQIALANLDSARRRAWTRFYQDPLRSSTAEAVIECEQLTLQFTGDVFALDRVADLTSLLAREDDGSDLCPLLQAQVATMSHRFADADRHLAEADRRGADPDVLNHVRLGIAQARGSDPCRVLRQRRNAAVNSRRPEDLVALGAVMADLGDFADADRTYCKALEHCRDISPFLPAWACFQRGLLWGEQIPEPNLDRAAHCYRSALEYLPGYCRARIHLAEISLARKKPETAVELLEPVLASGDPEVPWRLAQAKALQGRTADSASFMEVARAGFELICERHLLAFADHGAAFYAAHEPNTRKGLDLALTNVSNRPTIRAYEQAHSIARSAHNRQTALDLLMAAKGRWGSTKAFAVSSLAR